MPAPDAASTEEALIAARSANPFAMSPARVATFIHRNPYAALATLRRDGSPLATPVALVLRGGEVHFSVRADSGPARRIARDPRVSVTVFAREWPPSHLILGGVAQQITDDDNSLKFAAAHPTLSLLGPTEPTLGDWLHEYTSIPRHVFRLEVRHQDSLDGALMREGDERSMVLKPAGT